MPVTENDAPGAWSVCVRPNPRAQLRLFCFPYAGGSASFFRTWAEGLPPSVEVHAIELPGRGTRRNEPPFTQLSLLAVALGRVLRPLMDRPFAFFGHSVGSVVAYELARLLRREGRQEPLHLFASAHRAPHLPDPHPPLSHLPRAQLIEELKRLNGTPREALAHDELMELVLPYLRADFGMDETYTYTEEPPLGCPLTTLGSLEDPRASRPEMEAWRRHTSARFRFRLFPGDHFYLQAARPQVLASLAEDLGSSVSLS
jgi:medium-chain acyl-[acyl-carrier-protein] hydrolase